MKDHFKSLEVVNGSLSLVVSLLKFSLAKKEGVMKLGVCASICVTLLVLTSLLPSRAKATPTLAMPGVLDTAGSCLIDLTCQDPMMLGRLKYYGISWHPGTYTERSTLFHSYTVQRSQNSCYQFAQMLFTECGLSDPVTVNFVTGFTTSTISYVTTPNTGMAYMPGLMPAFQTYFNENSGGAPWMPIITGFVMSN